MRIRGLCDAFGDKLPITAYCSHSQANRDQGDFEETYAAHPDCFQDTFYNKKGYMTKGYMYQLSCLMEIPKAH